MSLTQSHNLKMSARTKKVKHLTFTGQTAGRFSTKLHRSDQLVYKLCCAYHWHVLLCCIKSPLEKTLPGFYWLKLLKPTTSTTHVLTFTGQTKYAAVLSLIYNTFWETYNVFL